MLFPYYPAAPHPYRFELHKEMHFSAAHFIPHPDAGDCRRVHGHTYVVDLTVAGDELDDAGFLVNFQDLKRLVHDRFDHRLLNDCPDLARRMPTTETLAETVCRIVQEYLDSRPNRPRVVQVIVRETPTSYVVYRPLQKNG